MSKGQDKIHKVMREYKEGTLHSGSGQLVTSRDQAIAIALSEAKKQGYKGAKVEKHSPPMVVIDHQKVNDHRQITQ